MAKVRKKTTATGNALADKLTFLRDECGFKDVEAAKASGGGKDFPLGNGQSAVIEKATVQFIKGDNVMFSWVMVGTGDKNAEIKHAENNTIWTTDPSGAPLPVEKIRQKAAYVRADLEAMGVDWATAYDGWIEALATAPTAASLHIEEAEGVEVVVDVWQKTGSEFVNYRVVPDCHAR